MELENKRKTLERDCEGFSLKTLKAEPRGRKHRQQQQGRRQERSRTQRSHQEKTNHSTLQRSRSKQKKCLGPRAESHPAR